MSGGLTELSHPGASLERLQAAHRPCRLRCRRRCGALRRRRRLGDGQQRGQPGHRVRRGPDRHIPIRHGAADLAEHRFDVQPAGNRRRPTRRRHIPQRRRISCDQRIGPPPIRRGQSGELIHDQHRPPAPRSPPTAKPPGCRAASWAWPTALPGCPSGVGPGLFRSCSHGSVRSRDRPTIRTPRGTPVVLPGWFPGREQVFDGMSSQ